MVQGYRHDSEYGNNHQPNLPFLLHLQAQEDIKWETNRDKICQNSQACSGYYERKLLNATPCQARFPVLLNGRALKNDSNKGGDHEREVQCSCCPDNVSHYVFDTGETDQEDEDRLFDQCENRIVDSADNVDPDHSCRRVHGQGNVPIVNAYAELFHTWIDERRLACISVTLVLDESRLT